MTSRFNSNVFVEIGEAIGNVANRHWPRSSRAERLSESFQRLRETGPTLKLGEAGQEEVQVDNGVIEGTYRIVSHEEEA
jgi:hypothetical protein